MRFSSARKPPMASPKPGEKRRARVALARRRDGGGVHSGVLCPDVGVELDELLGQGLRVGEVELNHLHAALHQQELRQKGGRGKEAYMVRRALCGTVY